MMKKTTTTAVSQSSMPTEEGKGWDTVWMWNREKRAEMPMENSYSMETMPSQRRQVKRARQCRMACTMELRNIKLNYQRDQPSTLR